MWSFHLQYRAGLQRFRMCSILCVRFFWIKTCSLHGTAGRRTQHFIVLVTSRLWVSGGLGLPSPLALEWQILCWVLWSDDCFHIPSILLKALVLPGLVPNCGSVVLWLLSSLSSALFPLVTSALPTGPTVPLWTARHVMGLWDGGAMSKPVFFPNYAPFIPRCLLPTWVCISFHFGLQDKGIHKSFGIAVLPLVKSDVFFPN